MKPQNTPPEDQFSNILKTVFNEPSKMLEAYSFFHNYSIQNQVLAMMQLSARGIPLSPIASYQTWKRLGRQVKLNSEGIYLLQPIKVRKRVKKGEEDDGTYVTIPRFMLAKRWHPLSSTYVPCSKCRGNGGFFVDRTSSRSKVCDACAGIGYDPKKQAYTMPETPNFSFDKVASEFGIKKTEFEYLGGNVQGYAALNSFAVNPLAQLPAKTTFHEFAHILLGHTQADGVSVLIDDETTQRNLCEVEAEAVALICVSVLGLEGAEYCRGYIKNWLHGVSSIPEESARKIITVADRIIKAGTVGLKRYGKVAEEEAA